MTAILVVTLWIIPAIAAFALGQSKDRFGLSVAMALLGWAGVIVMLIVPKPHAKEVADTARRMRLEQEARDLMNRPPS